MKKEFSLHWKSSKKPNKQRKYQKNAPLHIRQKFLSSHLSPELRKKYSRRAVQVIVGDKVKVMRGQYKGKENKVERVDTKSLRVYITGIERAKRDGTKPLIPIKSSNIMIIELKLDDKMRKKSLAKTLSEKLSLSGKSEKIAETGVAVPGVKKKVTRVSTDKDNVVVNNDINKRKDE